MCSSGRFFKNTRDSGPTESTEPRSPWAQIIRVHYRAIYHAKYQHDDFIDYLLQVVREDPRLRESGDVVVLELVGVQSIDKQPDLDYIETGLRRQAAAYGLECEGSGCLQVGPKLRKFRLDVMFSLR